MPKLTIPVDLFESFAAQVRVVDELHDTTRPRHWPILLRRPFGEFIQVVVLREYLCDPAVFAGASAATPTALAPAAFAPAAFAPAAQKELEKGWRQRNRREGSWEASIGTYPTLVDL